MLLNFGIFSIPFHGDEIHGLLRNPTVTQIDLFFERMVSLKGLFQRPLSVLSYALNFHFFGTSSFSFHLTNLIIHLVNITLLFHFAKKLELPSLFCASVFAWHPLTTSCVAQIYGRNYSLGSVFLLSALLLNTRHILFWTLMLLSKQVFLYYPLLLLWRDRAWPSSRVIFVTLVAGLGIFFVHILPNLGNAPVSPLGYAISQLHHFPLILWRVFILPGQTSLIHNLQFIGSISLGSVFGLMLFLSLLLAAWRNRQNHFGLLLGWFLLAYLPTNSLIPKSEVLVEWRLYPALIFFALLTGSLFRHGYLRWLYPLACGCFLLYQISVYQDPEQTYLQVLQQYPKSAVAWNNLGYHYFEQEKLPDAEQCFLESHRLEKNYRRPMANLYLLYNRQNRPEEAIEWRSRILSQEPT